MTAFSATGIRADGAMSKSARERKGFLPLFPCCVLLADHGDGSKLYNATEHAGGNVGTARVVAKVLP